MKIFKIGCGLLVAAGTLFGQHYQISTIGGNGTQGWSGDLGAATSAQFNNPLNVLVDPRGGVYLTDYGNSSIRKIFPDGSVNSITGNGSAGFSGDGGSAIGAQLSSPHEIALDSAGNLYIADTANARVRRIDKSGNISTFAGTGTRGYSGDGGPAISANLTLPTGVAVDSKGNVYIADGGNSSVRKVTPDGNISTFAGVGFLTFGGFSGEGKPATQAFLGKPFSVSTDAAGNVYISDIGLSRLFRVGTDGIIHTIEVNFFAQSVAIDNTGTIFFADYHTHTVKKILPNGTILWVGGNGTPGYTGDGGVATSAQMNQPYGIALDTAGNIYVAEAANAVIRELTPVANTLSAVANAASIKAFDVPGPLSSDATVPIAPGELIVMFGQNLGPATLQINTVTNGFFGTSLTGTKVTVQGIPAPIIYTSSSFVAAIVPYEVAGLTAADVAVTYQGRTSDYYVPVAATSPGIFTLNQSGSGQAAAINLDGTPNGPSNPIAAGSYISLYATGEGTTTPGGVDGKLVGLQAPYPTPQAPVQVTVEGLAANVSYAGGAPGEVAGVMQVNVQIPAGTPAGPVDVQLNVGGVFSQTVQIYVSTQ